MSYQEAEIAAMVREVVTRTLGNRASRVLVDADSVAGIPAGTKNHPIPANAIVTPLARQIALERKITFSEQGAELVDQLPAANHQRLTANGQTVALAADHGGYQMKEMLKGMVEAAGYEVVDCGTHSQESVDYPDYAYAAARLVGSGRVKQAIIIDGAGIGSCMVANKVPGVRAALCYDQASAFNSREHNDANVLTLGAGLIGASLAKQIVQTWLATDFGGGRHARRVNKIMDIEKRFTRENQS